MVLVAPIEKPWRFASGKSGPTDLSTTGERSKKYPARAVKSERRTFSAPKASWYEFRKSKTRRCSAGVRTSLLVACVWLKFNGTLRKRVKSCNRKSKENVVWKKAELEIPMP